MPKLKYPKDRNGNSILGEQYGITITRPWNNAMYEHNDAIAETMKEAIAAALFKALKEYDDATMRIISKAVCAYSQGSMYSTKNIYINTLLRLEQTQNHWLHSDTWPDLIKAGLVEQLPQQMIGYDKI